MTYDEILEDNHGLYHRLRLTLDGNVLQDCPENVEFNNMANDAAGIELGTTYASVLTMEIREPSVEILNQEVFVEDGVRDPEEKFVWKALGWFMAVSSSHDRGTVKYTLYDRMAYKLAGQYVTSLTFPNTDKAVIEELCTRCDVKLTGTLTEHVVETMPCGTNKEVLGYMLQLQGKNAVFNENGDLELKWYEDKGYTLTDAQIYMEGDASTTQSFTVGFIKNTRSVKKPETKYEEQTTYDSEGNEHTAQVPYTEESTEEQTYTAGDGVQGISFTNPYMTQAIVNELYEKLKTFSYTPATFDFVGDYRVRAMDIVTVKTDGGKIYTVPVMAVEHSSDGGLASTIYSYGVSESSNAIDSGNSTSRAMKRYDADLAYLKAVYANTMNAERARILFLQTKELKAEVGKFGYLHTEELEAVAANLGYAKIDEATIKKLFLDTGIVKDLTVTEDLRVTGTLSGLRITGDVIDANTISAKSIILKDQGEDGLIYQINATAGGLSLEELSEKEYREKLSGTDIVAHSITAEQLSVKELSALEATIAGFQIGDAIAYAKQSYDDVIPGVYIGKDGLGLGKGTFYVNAEGYMKATAADIEGDIYATSLQVNEVIGKGTIEMAGETYPITYTNTIQSSLPNTDVAGVFVGVLGDSEVYGGSGYKALAGIAFDLEGNATLTAEKAVVEADLLRCEGDIELSGSLSAVGGIKSDKNITAYGSVISTGAVTAKGEKNVSSAITRPTTQVTVPKGGPMTTNKSFTVSRSGFSPIAVWMEDTGNGYVVPLVCKISGNTIVYRVRNLDTSEQKTVTITFAVLWKAS